MPPRVFWLGFIGICLAIILAGSLFGPIARTPSGMPAGAAVDPGPALFWIAVCLAFYFLPALVAFNRYHPETRAITALDLLLGWSVVGWVAALVWALTGPGARAPDPGPELVEGCREKDRRHSD